MYSKLRDKTGKRFVKKYLGGGPVNPGKFTGEMQTGQDGNMYAWNGSIWELQSGLGVNMSGMPGMNTSSVTGQMIGTPSFGTQPLATPGQTIGNAVQSAVDAVKTGFETDYDNWNTADDALDAAKTARQDINRADFGNWSEYREAREAATADVQEARQARREAGRTIGGGQARRDERREERAARQEERAANAAERDARFREGFGGQADGTLGSAIGNFADGNWKTGVADLAVSGMKAVDNLAMGDKNFGAQSEAIDGAVHGVSSALMKSGDPYAMAAGAILEGANFLTKAGGQTVQGFDVDINSSGYGDMGHMASSSSRDFGAMIGLGGLNQKSMQRKLAKRNLQAQMAMNAANIADEQMFEQEARANSIQNTIMNNNIALAGGLETNLLGG